ncbi:MAG: hypothetical protein NTY13_01935 [Chlamydiae bacterium]|nr:hypothetical protein [Chlamydiota bacterium]
MSDTKFPKMHIELDDIIAKALKKIGGKDENDLCRFLPGNSGGYIHHFTLRKMRNNEPSILTDMIQKYIVQNETPGRLNPKQRAPRGSRKKKDILSFSRGDVERLVQIARQVGDSDMLSKLSPKRSLTRLKKELIKSIKLGVVEQDLWKAYTDSIYNYHSPFAIASIPSN